MSKRLLAVAVLALGLIAFGARVATGPLFTGDQGSGAPAWTDDLVQDYVSAKAWLDGADPYAPTLDLRDRYLEGSSINDGAPPDQRNPHPPPAFLLVAPLTLVSYEVARALWLVAMGSAIVVSIALVVREVGGSRILAAVAGVGALAVPVVQKDLSFGQSNGLILLGLVLAWRWARRGAQARAGVALGATVAIKLFPLLLLLPLIRARRWRAVAAASACAVVLLGVATIAVGAASTGSYVSQAGPSNFAYWRAGPMNVSLAGIAYRWLTENPWRDSAVDLPALALTLSIVAGLACAIAAWRTRARATGDPFWAAVPWMILATPLAWEHYLVLALPVAILVVAQPAKEGRLPPVALAIAVAVLAIGTPPGVSTTVPGISDLQQLLAYGLPTYALLLIGVWGLRREGRASTPGSTGPEADHSSGLQSRTR